MADQSAGSSSGAIDHEGDVSPESHITKIREDFESMMTSGRFSGYDAVITLLSDQLNTELSHFLLEFIQNADDTRYASTTIPSLQFSMQGDYLVINSNQCGFSHSDVDSLCNLCASTKKGNTDTVGEKGIGFKSVFKIADVVHISSRGYNFKFDKNIPLGRVVPTWAELPQKFAKPGLTQFLLYIPNQEYMKDLKLALEKFDDAMILFLRQLRTVEISIDGITRRFTREDHEGELGGMRSVTKFDNAKRIVHTLDHVIIKKQVTMTLQEQKRPGVETSEVTLAFPVQGNTPTIAPRSICNYLPIRATPFSFLIQADFILNAAREDLDSTSKTWNNHLLNGVAQTFLQAIHHFNKLPVFQYSWPQYLPNKDNYYQCGDTFW